MAISLCACAPKVANNTLGVDRELNYCNEQVQKTLSSIGDTTMMPRNILAGQSDWNLVPVRIEESGQSVSGPGYCGTITKIQKVKRCWRQPGITLKF